VTTLSGEQIIWFRKKYCRNHGLINTETLSTIQKICPRKKTFDTKVTIAVGFLRWLFNYQREEIQLLLECRGIHISTGEISKLSEEFLLRFYVLHKKHSSQMQKVFGKNGGYILHLDGSAESGDEITFTAKEGVTGFTIDSWIMPSEGREYIKPFLESIRHNYGKPLTVVRDMWEEIAVSVSEVFPGVLQQVCHYHFVRNLGDIVFKHRYEELRRLILKTNILARILSLKKICMDGISSHNRIVIAEHYWVKLAIEYVLYPRERKSGYPFVLPYLEVMNRIMEVLDMLKKIVMWNAWHNMGVWVVLKFEEYLQKLAETMEVKALHSKIKVIWEWFEEIRKVLRVSREFSTNEQEVSPTKANEMEPEFNDTIMKIMQEGRKLGDEYVEISKRIFQNCRDHVDELFVKVKDIHGEEISIVRHNGIEELNHRWSRMHIRRRTGRSRTTMEMEKYGALLAVFSNIENEEYIKTILDDVKDFVREIQEVTESQVLEARRLIRTFPQSPLIRSDSERPGILRGFIRLIDDAFEDVLDRDIEGWLSNFYTDAIMTP
jgi:Asp-tRNA(Asn)/Glu-tRNA(Gln) amidotransferase C subunit